MTPEQEHWIEASDPTTLGWFVSLAYLLAALLAARAFWMCKAGVRGVRPDVVVDAGMIRLATWWFGVAVMLLLLGLNKELDLLQKLLRVWGKSAAISQGWYANRGVVQHAFVAGIALLAVGAAGFMVHYIRGVSARIMPALIGVGLILFYVVFQTAMFNGLRDAMPALLTPATWALEPAGILLVCWSATRAMYPGPPS